MSTRLEDLLKRLENLEREQLRLKTNIDLIKEEAKSLQKEVTPEPEQETFEPLTPPKVEDIEAVKPQKPFVYEPMAAAPVEKKEPTHVNTSTPKTNLESYTYKQKDTLSLEKFLGENLASKIGIAVLILGTGIFAKYAIDHNWITPFLRILFGYLLGGAIYFTALKFKQKYKNLSAILMAGSLCIAYLISYFAFSLYDFYPRWLAFLLLLVFTGHAVQQALIYKIQAMAIISLVGAYAVPFLLSTNSGKAEYLFTYMAVINIGITFLSRRENWNILWNSSFGLTWVIYLSWAIDFNDSVWRDTVSILFLLVFFGIFMWNLIYFASQKETFLKRHFLFHFGVMSLLLFTIGNLVMDSYNGSDYRSAFSLFCTVLYGGLYLWLRKDEKYNRLFVDMILGVSIIYFTGFVSIALDNEWKTSMWAVEALVLAYFGIKHDNGLLRRGSFYIGVLTAISASIDMSNYYNDVFARSYEQPFFNKIFALNLFLSALLFANYKIQEKKNRTLVDPELSTQGLSLIAFTLMTYLTPMIDLSFAIKQEYLAAQWSPQWYNAVITTSLWSFTVLFVGVSKMVLDRKNKSEKLDNLYAGLVALLSLLYLILVLSTQYSTATHKGLSLPVADILTINFLSMIPLVFLWYVGNQFKSAYDSLSNHFFVVASRIYLLIFLSIELSMFLELGFLEKQNKVALSILWGAYAVYQIVDGVRKKRAEFRWIGLILLALTLLKLFLLDLAQLSTISKTISLICLGIFLLLVSYLYNRFKDRFELTDEEVQKK